MSNLCEAEFENINLANFFDQEVENWRAKMVKVYGDQHPYTFYVTAGHDFEDMILKIVDLDTSERESRKHEPFKNLQKMSDVDKKAEKDFHEILSRMEEKQPTPQLKEYFELEYSDCTKRVSKQMAFQAPVINEVEKFLIEMEEFGNAELKALRDRISKWIYDKGFSMLNNIDKSYSLLSDQPFAMTVWFECSANLTSKEVRTAFLADQKEMSNLWKKAFDDLLVCSSNCFNKISKCS